MITGIILAGGKSTRMGTDKCFLDFRGETFIQRSINLLSTITKTIIVSSNNEAFKSFGFSVVEDEIKNIGPIGGIYSCLKHSPNTVNLLIPCDLPFLSAALLKYLLDFAEFYDAVVPVYNDKVEPLLAVFDQFISLHS